jgi:hypothetical protein
LAKVVVVVALASALGCGGPSLDVPGRQDTPWSLELDPSREDGSVPLTFRGRIRMAPASGAPWLIQGELSDAQERALRRAEVSQALRERAIPLRYWRAAEDAFMQPLLWLRAGESYTLAWEGLGVLTTFEAASDGARPATQLLPSAGRPKHRLVVVCDLLDTSKLEAITLEPGGVALQPLPEMIGVPRTGCVTLSAASPLSVAAVSPPLIGGSLLDPAPWLPATSAEPPPVPPCEGVATARDCLDVQDDRIFITPGVEDELWLLERPERALVELRAGRRTLLVRGLEPETSIELRASVLSAESGLDRARLSLTTAPARRHLVLNEVLANPLGPENGGEWIELWNDSDRSAWLGDLWLYDSGGRIALPDIELDPGELALLVGDAFQPSASDVPVPPGVRVVRMASLGTRGLSNSGEALLLVGPEGTLSRFPGLVAKTAGHSMARRTPDAADDDDEAFAEHADPGASPGAPNEF